MKRIDRKPSFWLQAVLILAPVIVLTFVGVLSARKDRRAVRNEAEQQAREFAERAGAAIWEALQAPNTMFMHGEARREQGAPMIIAHWRAEDGYTGSVRRIEVDRANGLVFPPPYDPAPTPQALDSSGLSAIQTEAWQALSKAHGIEEVRARAGAFLEMSPPTNHQAAARMLLGRALAEAKDYAAAATEFAAVTNLQPRSVSEAGLPLDVLARLGLFEAQQKRGLFRNSQELQARKLELLRYAIEHPSALTPELLRREGGEGNSKSQIPNSNGEGAKNGNAPDRNDWQRLEQRWDWDEEARQVYAAWIRPVRAEASAARLSSVSPGAVPPVFERSTNASFRWVEVSEQRAVKTDRGFAGRFPAVITSWCVIQVPNPTGAALFYHRVSDLKQIIDGVLARLNMPAFLDASVSLAGTNVLSANNMEVVEVASGGKGGGQFLRRSIPKELPEVLAAFTRFEEGQPLLKVNMHLIAPDLLYLQQSQRAIWLGLVIGAAALTAVIGFLSAYRAFARQLRLAEMKSNFVSSVSHELRAPIASVRLMAEGLERGTVADPDKQREYFRFIVQECRRLSAMIENVLDFARIDQGRKQYAIEPTNLKKVVEQTLKVMAPNAAEHGVILRENIIDADADWTAMADGQAIQQALVNLIDNAIKHSRSGQEVRIALEQTEPEEEVPSIFRISVIDSGPGIPPAEHARIFERFYRLGSELRRETAGVGIGLSIVKHVMESHGGRVGVESEPGKGSMFVLELPTGMEAGGEVKRRKGEEVRA